jgi:hypothetical protein
MPTVAFGPYLPAFLHRPRSDEQLEQGMSVRALSPGMRIAMGVLGGAGVLVALVLLAAELRDALGGKTMAWVAAMVLLVAGLIALRVLRAALRGTITVRDGRP